MRLSPKRGLTFLLSVCMFVIVYLNVLSFVDHEQQMATLFSVQDGMAPLDDPGERYVIRGGEVLRVDSDRYRQLINEVEHSDKLIQHGPVGIHTVKLHPGLDTARILLDARDAAHKGQLFEKKETPKITEIRMPSHRGRTGKRSIWPNPRERYDDRILDQILYVPTNIKNKREKKLSDDPGMTNLTEDISPLKTILMWSGVGDMKGGRTHFLEDKCLVDTCHVTDNAALLEKVDAVVFNFDPVYYTWTRPPNQIWILWMLESPLHTASLRDMKNQVNWTATYRWDSTIVTPYEKFLTYKNGQFPTKPDKNYATGKTRKVAWFVSNCGARNKRLEYAEELAKYIEVDIYGACGPFKCSRMDQDACLNILRRDYKFYLAFENSNCDQYITEKFFWNGLKSDVIPIVMGAQKSDYVAAAPPQSFIHVEDYTSPRDLARYLHRLDQNDTLYNEHFRWKSMGEFVNTKFWCRLCAMLHDTSIPHHVYPNIEQWWRRNGTCTLDRWDRPTDHINDWKKFVYSNL